MKKKKTLDSILAAFKLISTSKLSKMESDEKFSLIKIAMTLQKVNAEFEQLLKNAQEKMRPAEVDGVIEKLQSNIELTNDEKNILDKFNMDMQKCLKSELNKEIEVEIEPLSENAINNYIASNDFSVNEIMLVYNLIGS